MPVPLETVSGTKKQSIARVEMFTDAALAADDRRLVGHFEDGVYDGNGALVAPTQFGTFRVERRFGDIKQHVLTGTDPVTGQPMSVSVAGLATLIQVALYQYRAADLAAAQPAPAPTA